MIHAMLRRQFRQRLVTPDHLQRDPRPELSEYPLRVTLPINPPFSGQIIAYRPIRKKESHLCNRDTHFPLSHANDRDNHAI